MPGPGLETRHIRVPGPGPWHPGEGPARAGAGDPWLERGADHSGTQQSVKDREVGWGQDRRGQGQSLRPWCPVLTPGDLSSVPTMPCLSFSPTAEGDWTLTFGVGSPPAPRKGTEAAGTGGTPLGRATWPGHCPLPLGKAAPQPHQVHPLHSPPTSHHSRVFTQFLTSLPAPQSICCPVRGTQAHLLQPPGPLV